MLDRQAACLADAAHRRYDRNGLEPWGETRLRGLGAVLSALIVGVGLIAAAAPARALTPIVVPPAAAAVDLTHIVQRFAGEGDRIEVTTAPVADGVVRRIEIAARRPGSAASWAVFALTNNSDEQIDRLLVAPHYRLVGSGVVWPDLGAVRIHDITASTGFRPEREPVKDADVFFITLDPGATVTYVAELGTTALPQLYLWSPDAYKASVNNLTLYKGIVLGIAGLLALMLTVIFVVRGNIMFPAAAALAWAVLGWLAIDFGFLDRLFDIDPLREGIYRAGAEAILAATLIVFLVAYLNLNRWHVRFVHIALAWLICLLALVGIAVVDAPVAAGIARMSLAAVAVLGLGVVVWLALHGYDRAVMLIPTWFLLLVWVAAAGLTVSGLLANDLVEPALMGGLVLIVLLIGFTVMQHAFGGAGLAFGMGSDLERQALAVTGAGDVVWDWDVAADRVHVPPEFEDQLGVERGTLRGPAANWLEVLHPSDRDRFRGALDAIVAERRGKITEPFRFRRKAGPELWMLLRARPVIGDSGEVTRCVGTLIDVTSSKTAEERLLQNAVYDSLTGLPNRELFLDRLDAALAVSAAEEGARFTVLMIDLEGCRRVPDNVGVPVGDTILLTLVRRVSRLLRPQDTLARLAGDQFGVILLSERDPERVIDFTESLRRSLDSPVSFAGHELVLSTAIGLALSEPGEMAAREEIVRNAEVAMYQAKRVGGDHVEVFKPAMLTAKTERLLIEGELSRALERDEIKLDFQPIMRLADGAVAGFAAGLRWDHKRYGRRAAAEFWSIAEQTGLSADFGRFALEGAARQLAAWRRLMPHDAALFVTVPVSAQQFARHDLLLTVKSTLARAFVARGTLLLAVTEKTVMHNPEHAESMLTRLHELGVGLALAEFGSAHGSLAYLQSLPFDMITLDPMLMRWPDRSHRRAAILRSLVQLGADLDVNLVVEGVDTDADAAEVHQIGCRLARGLVFGDAGTPEAAERLLTTTRPDMTVRRRGLFGAVKA
jgi:diguanylate cyclase (GGDEF)-like protein/PAS domain S-box-containing protein